MYDDCLGYRVEPMSPEAGKVGYKLHGPKATYTLIRSVNNAQILFALNSKGNVCQIKGNSWFTDKDGVLIPVNAF